jgi:hypothetical protein
MPRSLAEQCFSIFIDPLTLFSLDFPQLIVGSKTKAHLQRAPGPFVRAV